MENMHILKNSASVNIIEVTENGFKLLANGICDEGYTRNAKANSTQRYIGIT